MILENKNRIIQTAIEAFKSKGIVATTMSDIAKLANYDRRTIYRYFANKDELVLEVVVWILKDWNEFQQTIFDTVSGTGLDRFSDYYKRIIQEEERMDLVVLITEFDMIFDIEVFREKTDREDLIKEYQDAAIYAHRLLSDLLHLGANDGSMKKVKTEELVPVIHNVMWSTIQKASISSRSINDTLSIDFVDIIHKQINIYKEYLRG